MVDRDVCGVVTKPIPVQCRLDVLITRREAWGLHGGEFIRPPAQPCAYIYSSVLDISALPVVHATSSRTTALFTYNGLGLQLSHLTATFSTPISPPQAHTAHHGRPENPHLPLRLHLPPPCYNNSSPFSPPARNLPRPRYHPPPPLRRPPTLCHSTPHNAPLHDARPPRHHHPPRRRLREAHPLAVRTLSRCGGV